MEDTTLGWRFVNPRMREAYPPITLGETAECVAEQWTVSRERQDAFALESQRRAVAAIEAGRFDGQLVPVTVAGRKGASTVVDRDEHPRPDVGQALAALKARSDQQDSDRGNSSRINDGAAALLRSRPIAPAAGTAADGGRRDRRRRRHPDVMGIGHVRPWVLAGGPRAADRT
jgi:acetyl-CoA acetyltransferase